MKTVRDCIIIPSLQTTKGMPLNFDAFCGSGGLGSKAEKIDASKQKTLCSKFLIQIYEIRAPAYSKGSNKDVGSNGRVN